MADTGHEEYTRYQRRIARKSFTVSVVIGLGLFALGSEAIARGLVLGALFSVINFIIMALLLPRQISSSRKRSSGIALVSMLLRLAILAIPLIVGLKVEGFYWPAVAVGLFAVPITIFIDQYISNWLARKTAR